MVSAARKAIQSYKLGYDPHVLRIEAKDLVILPKAVILASFLFLKSNSRGSALFGKKVVLQPVKKFPVSWNKEMHYNVHNNALLIPILNQIKPVYILHPISLTYVLILSSHLCVSGPFLQTSLQNSACISLQSCMC